MTTKRTGVVVCGGQSRRMGADKSTLVYHELQQRYHVYHLLRLCCDHVVLSCRSNQAQSVAAEYECIEDDESLGLYGPAAGVLTVHRCYPDHDLLLVGCDYPLIETADLQMLISASRGIRSAAFVNDDQMPEPLLSLLLKKDLDLLDHSIRSLGGSIRRFLQQQPIAEVIHPYPERLMSVDDPETYQRIVRQLGRQS